MDKGIFDCEDLEKDIEKEIGDFSKLDSKRLEKDMWNYSITKAGFIFGRKAQIQERQRLGKEVGEAVKKLKEVLISRLCRPNKPVNTFENAREQEEIINEEIDEIFGEIAK